MRLALIYPPIADPRAPQLALPSLSAWLRQRGISVTLHDLNIIAIEAFAQKDILIDLTERVIAKANGPDPDGTYLRMAAISERLQYTATTAFDALRNCNSFFDPHRHAEARDTISALLKVVSTASNAGVSVDIDPIDYRVNGIDSRSLADLIHVTSNQEADAFHFFWEREVFSKLAGENPDAVGITITNRQQILPGLFLARALRQKGHFVVIGGTVYSKFAAALASKPSFFEHFADAVVVYEGETSLEALLDQLAGRRDLSKVPNLLYLDRGQVRANPTHIENVAELPTPDFTGLPLDRYLTPFPVLPILTGKGCYFNRCKFCDIPFINHVSRKPYRIRPVEAIVDDVHQLKARFGASHFVITDEALSPQLLRKMADALERHASDFSFTGYARLEHGFDAETCQRLAAAGFKKLFFGLESGSQRIIDHMDKAVQIDRVSDILANCRHAGIDFHIFSIIGFPEEKMEDAQQTYQFFIDNEAHINTPSCSFDIHPFGLELRTAYFDHKDDFGIKLKYDAMSKDFTIGLSGEEWVNTRGLNHKDVMTLIYGTYLPALRQVYRTYHGAGKNIWPSFEEYAVLYGYHYRDRRFSSQTALPIDSSAAFSFKWNTAWPILQTDNGFVTVTPGMAVIMDHQTKDLFISDRAGTWSDHIHAYKGNLSEEELINILSNLLATGLIQINIAGTIQTSVVSKSMQQTSHLHGGTP